MARLLALFFIFAMFCTALLPGASKAADLGIKSLRMGTHPDKTRMVIELSRRSDFRAFMLYNPSRLVVDLPAFNWQGPPPAPPSGGLASAIRHGTLEPGIARIVVDLRKAGTIKSAFFLPSSSTIPDRVVIDFAAAPPGHIPASERMYGALKSSSPVTGHLAPPATLKTPSPAIPTPSANPPPSPGLHKNRPVIVIDAGHGGQDPGAIGANGKKEKDVTLAMARELKNVLEETGRYRVHLTRDTDKFIKLQERVAIGRRHAADLFISLHADSIDKAGVSGASIYTLSNKASDAQTAKLAARENCADLIAGVDLSHEDKEVANILIDLAMRDTMNQSKFFANRIVSEAKSGGIRLLDSPHRFAGFAVLKAPDVPSVLIEMGFMSNREEVGRLSTPAYRRKIATTIARGIDGYFAKVRKGD